MTALNIYKTEKGLKISLAKRDPNGLSRLIEAANKNGGALLDTKYIMSHTKYKWKCKEGHIFLARASKVFLGQWCRKCWNNNKRFYIEDLIEIAKSKDGKLLSTKYLGFYRKYKWECKAGHKWTTTISNIKNHWCRQCGNDAQRGNLQSLKNIAKLRNGQCLSIEYITTHCKYLWKCNNEHIWSASGAHIKSGKWCPKCSYRISRPEIEIQQFIYSLFPDAQFNKRGLLNNKKFELDIYIPSLNKAIEFDGIYWHNRPSAIERDGRKNQDCLKLGIGLLRIKELEYRNNPLIVKNKILNYLKYGIIEKVHYLKESQL